jgi:hypothetical protein
MAAGGIFLWAGFGDGPPDTWGVAAVALIGLVVISVGCLPALAAITGRTTHLLAELIEALDWLAQ